MSLRAARARAAGQPAPDPPQRGQRPGEVARPPDPRVVAQGGRLGEHLRGGPEDRVDRLQLVPHPAGQPVVRAGRGHDRPPSARTGAFIWSWVVGRSAAETGKNSNRREPSRLAWSGHTEKVRNVPAPRGGGSGVAGGGPGGGGDLARGGGEQAPALVPQRRP